MRRLALASLLLAGALSAQDEMPMPKTIREAYNMVTQLHGEWAAAAKAFDGAKAAAAMEKVHRIHHHAEMNLGMYPMSDHQDLIFDPAHGIDEWANAKKIWNSTQKVSGSTTTKIVLWGKYILNAENAHKQVMNLILKYHTDKNATFAAKGRDKAIDDADANHVLRHFIIKESGTTGKARLN